MVKRKLSALRRLHDLNSFLITEATATHIIGENPTIEWLKGGNTISLNGRFSLFDLFDLLLIVNRLEGNPLQVDRVLYKSIC